MAPQVQISWVDRDVPMDQPIAPKRVLETETFKKAVAHLAVELGAVWAQKQAKALVRRLTSIAKHAEARGLTVQVSARNQATAPPPWDPYNGLAVEVRLIRDDRRVEADFNIYTGGFYRPVRGGSGFYTTPHRSDVLLDRVLALCSKYV